MNSGIYKIENKINNCLYIGKTKDFNKRWIQHKSDAKLYKDKSLLHQAMRDYGIENFEFSIIEELSLEEYLEKGSERERYWIEYYNAYSNPNNYNETIGGEGGSIGWTPSQEWKDKMSENKKEWYKTTEGIEKRKQQSEMMKGNSFSKGRTHSEEWKKQHSEAMKGEKNPNYNKHVGGKKCLCVELNLIFESTRQAEKELKVDHTRISAACRGVQKTAGGYHWQYI